VITNKELNKRRDPIRPVIDFCSPTRNAADSERVSGRNVNQA
jgi:hypothetical protein